MAGIIHFNVGEVRVLIAHTLAAPSHSPSYEDLFNPKYHKGGKVLKKNGWPDADNIDHALLPAGLFLVKDQGAYVMSNGKPSLQKPDGKGSVVAYAAEVNPGKLEFDDWYEAARRIFGGDDCVITLPVEMFQHAVEGKNDTDTFTLKVTKRSISLVS